MQLPTKIIWQLFHRQEVQLNLNFLWIGFPVAWKKLFFFFLRVYVWAMCKHLTCTSLCPLTYNQDLQKQRLYHQFSQGGIQFSKGKNAMWKGWLNPNLLLLRSVFVYNILSLTECRWLFPRGKPVPNAYMGRWPWRWKSWFLGALPRKDFCKIKVQSGKSASESSQGKKK